MRNLVGRGFFLTAVLGVIVSSPLVLAQRVAYLRGAEEVPAVSTEGSGTCTLEISEDGNSIMYELSYENLSGIVSQAHIHFGRTKTNGGVMVFLCTNADREGVPACPVSGTVTGTLTAADVIGPAKQGIEAGEFGKVVRAVTFRQSYCNVHTDLFPGGEIRGTVR